MGAGCGGQRPGENRQAGRGWGTTSQARSGLDTEIKLVRLSCQNLYRFGSENCGIISVVDTNLARGLLIESVKCDNGGSAEGRASNVKRQSGSKEADKKNPSSFAPNTAARFVHTNRRKTEGAIFVPSPFRGLALPSFSRQVPDAR